MKSAALLLFTLSLATNEIALSHDAHKCPPRKIHRETFWGESSKASTAAMRTSVTLSASWDDAQVLAAFGFTRAVAGDSVPGLDGTQATYRVGRTSISIVRSASTGLVVGVSRGSYTGFWIVDPC